MPYCHFDYYFPDKSSNDDPCLHIYSLAICKWHDNTYMENNEYSTVNPRSKLYNKVAGYKIQIKICYISKWKPGTRRKKYQNVNPIYCYNQNNKASMNFCALKLQIVVKRNGRDILSVFLGYKVRLWSSQTLQIYSKDTCSQPESAAPLGSSCSIV